MYLKELIEYLKQKHPDIIVPMGFHNPHSYRGYYDDLAFEPMENVTVETMLKIAQTALNTTYQGYKGGDFKMHEYVDVYLANYGECGEELGTILLDYMTGKYNTEDPSF